jgi:hypothetical protein
VSLVDVPTAIFEETGIISIEVKGIIPSGLRVGVPFHPQPDNSNRIHNPDSNMLFMRTLPKINVNNIVNS